VLVFAIGFYALLLSNVLFLTGVWGYGALAAGVALVPGPVMAALAAPNGIAQGFGRGGMADNRDRHGSSPMVEVIPRSGAKVGSGEIGPPSGFEDER
jgi:hypothetical protein